MKIAIFDSGFGGLSVLNFALKRLKNESFLYYADNENIPYGTKSRAEILKFTTNAAEFLIAHDAKAIVIACNTATSAAVSELRANFKLPIIAMEPAVKKAMDGIKGSNLPSRTLVIATPVTVAGAKLKELISRIRADESVDLLALPKLVEFAEKEEFCTQNVKKYLENELLKFDLKKYAFLVLGCTHFNYFKDSLRQILPPNVSIIDGVEGTTNKLIAELERLNLREENTQSVEYFYSGKPILDAAEQGKIMRYLSRLDEMEKIN